MRTNKRIKFDLNKKSRYNYSINPTVNGLNLTLNCNITFHIYYVTDFIYLEQATHLYEYFHVWFL